VVRTASSVEEVGLDDGVTALTQLGLMVKKALEALSGRRRRTAKAQFIGFPQRRRKPWERMFATAVFAAIPDEPPPVRLKTGDLPSSPDNARAVRPPSHRSFLLRNRLREEVFVRLKP
jgi:hypothetical protein